MEYSKLCNKCLEDKLDRQKHIEPLTNLLTNIKDESFVMTVSAPYGGGKTFFIDMLQKHLQANGCNTLYYNAWENDFAINPLISFLASFEEFEGLDKNSISDFIKAGSKLFGSKLLNSAEGIGIIAGAITANPLVADVTSAVVNTAKTVKKVSDEAKKENIFHELILAEQKSKKIREEFKEKLEKLIPTTKSENYPTDKLIIFIDDLDRCRPDYAIKFLEYIKHIFDVKNCIFVLAVDEEQLKSAVEVVYGSKNANGFLTRIIDFRFQLSEPNAQSFIKTLVDTLQWEKSEIFNTRPENITKEDEKNLFIEVLSELSTIFKLSIRDLEHILQDLNIVFKSLDKKNATPILYMVTYVIRNFSYRIKENVVDTLKAPLKSNDESIFIALSTYLNHLTALKERYHYAKNYGISLRHLLDCLIISQPIDFKSVFNSNSSVVLLPSCFLDKSAKEVHLYKKIEKHINDVFCENKLEKLEQ